MDNPFSSPTFERDGSFRLDEPVGALSISPSGRDVVLASRQGLHIIDLDNPYAPPRYLRHETRLEVADVQWSPFASRDHWVVSTSDSAAVVWNLEAATPQETINHRLCGREGHNRAISDINFSAHHPDTLATCGIDSFVLVWDLRSPRRPSSKFADWDAGAQQVKWNRNDPNILASAHNNRLQIWDARNGIRPLHTIEAHLTKIYGIDWNRNDSTCILTCSLDRTIKLWNFSDFQGGNLKPLRVMPTDFPVWRARHTPFGHGIVAMPQRDDYSVHLYDRRTYRIADRNAKVQSNHQFSGHEGNVREFLWRYRGGVDNDHDNRQFQLVTWGTDKKLLLHRVTDNITSKVGYTRGDPTPGGRINFTRKGARYRSFHDIGYEAASKDVVKSHEPSQLEIRRRMYGVGKAVGNTSRPTDKGKGAVDALTWIKGVKIHKSNGPVENAPDQAPVSADTTTKRPVWRDADEIGAELAWLADALGDSVEFAEIDIKKRRAVISFDAPWADRGKPCWMQCRLLYPLHYPATTEPLDIDVNFPPNISEATKTRLTFQLHAILDTHAALQRGCLESSIRFLLGQWTYEQSSNVHGDYRAPHENLRDDLLQSLGAQADDDDEDEIQPIGAATDLEGSGTLPSMNIKFSNANVPLPKACGAAFAPNGTLVCFFPSKTENPFEAFKATPKPVDDSNEDEKQKIFEGFYRENFADAEWDATGPSNLDYTSSSSDESDDSMTFSQDPVMPHRKSIPHFFNVRDNHLFEQDLVRIPENATSPSYPQGPSYVRLYDMKDLNPIKRPLAEEYVVSGRGDEVCRHNAKVAAEHGFEDHAHTWHLVALLLDHSVPLEQIILENGKDVLAVSSRYDDDIDRQDSGVEDTTADKAPPLSKRLRGRVKWGGSPFGGLNAFGGKPALVERLLQKYQEERDIQMLAMLTCVLAPVSALAKATPAMLDADPWQQPFALRYPAFNPTYYHSAAVAHSIEVGTQPATSLSKIASIRRRRQAGSFAATSVPTLVQRNSSSLGSSFSSSFKNPLAWISAGSSPNDPSSAMLLDDGDEQDAASDEETRASAPQYKVVLRLVNQDKFDEHGSIDTPFLDPRDAHKHALWRATYARQLGAWGLFSARATLLKFNGEDSAAMGVPPDPSERALGVSLRCMHCDDTENGHDLGEDATKVCGQCKRCVRLPQCGLCWQAVRAFCVGCYRCGHAAHFECWRSWRQAGHDLSAECPGGCGCECGVLDGHGAKDLVGAGGGWAGGGLAYDWTL